MEQAYRFDHTLFDILHRHLDALDKNSFFFKSRAEDGPIPDEVYNVFSLAAHRHPHAEMFIVLDGLAGISIESRRWLGPPGAVGFLEKGCFHDVGYIDVGSPTNVLWVALDKTRLRMHISSYFCGQYRMINGMDMEFSPYLFDQIHRELSWVRDDFIPCIRCYLSAFWHIVRRSVEDNDTSIIQENQWHARIVLEIEEYISAHISEKITLHDIAIVANLSAGYVSQIFKEYRGINLPDFIVQRKMEYAKELLLTSKQNISEIALCVGFNDPFYFSKVFKKSEGLSPRDFRTRHG